MREYDFTLTQTPNSDQLNAALAGLGLSSATYQYLNTSGVNVQTFWSGPLSAGDLTTLNNFMASYAPAPNGAPRTMFAIATDIFALSGSLPTPAAGTQKAHIIADLFGGSPPKWQLDAGSNAAAMAAVYAALTASNGLATFNAAQQLIMAAMYVQDNPNYLWHPSFDTTIAIGGRSP